MGATMAALHMAIENMVRAPRLFRSRSKCHAPTAPTASEVVRYAAITVCTKRYGKLGLKTTANHDPFGTNCPASFIIHPAGVCIQLFADRIHVAEMSVPTATMQVARKCSLGPTLLIPNSMTPRNPASRKNAE